MEVFFAISNFTFIHYISFKAFLGPKKLGIQFELLSNHLFEVIVCYALLPPNGYKILSTQFIFLQILYTFIQHLHH